MIPVFEPVIGQDEIEAVVAALRKGEISGSFGDTIPQFERQFAEYCGCKHGVAVSSGTTALHLAVAATGIGRGDSRTRLQAADPAEEKQYQEQGCRSLEL